MPGTDTAKREAIKHEAVNSTAHIFGVTSDYEMLWLAGAAIGKKRILEIGTFLGRTAMVLSKASGGSVITCDNLSYTWTGQGPDKRATKEELEARFRGRDITFIPEGLSEDLARRLILMQPLGFDLIFIDADHSYEGVYNDLTNAVGLLSPNGLICGHDLDNKDCPGVRTALEVLFPNKFVQTTRFMWALTSCK